MRISSLIVLKSHTFAKGTDGSPFSISGNLPHPAWSAVKQKMDPGAADRDSTSDRAQVRSDPGHCLQEPVAVNLRVVIRGGIPLTLKYGAMRYFAHFLLVLLVSFSFSCSSDDDEDVITKDGPFQISELAGSWEATQAFFGGETMNVDLIGEGGSATLNVQSSGRFTLNIDPADRPAYSVSGEMFWEEWDGRFYFAIEWDDAQGDWDPLLSRSLLLKASFSSKMNCLYSFCSIKPHVSALRAKDHLLT